jgi:hypothetical protein
MVHDPLLDFFISELESLESLPLHYDPVSAIMGPLIMIMGAPLVTEAAATAAAAAAADAAADAAAAGIREGAPPPPSPPPRIMERPLPPPQPPTTRSSSLPLKTAAVKARRRRFSTAPAANPLSIRVVARGQVPRLDPSVGVCLKFVFGGVGAVQRQQQ